MPNDFAYEEVLPGRYDGERPIPSTVVVRAIEARAEVASLEDLHQQRRQLLITLAPLKALHGPFGIWDDKRKQMVEALKVRARSALAATGQKTTEAMIEAEAYGDPQYLAFLDQGERDKIAYLHQANHLSEIEEQIRSRDIELTCYNAELRLQR